MIIFNKNFFNRKLVRTILVILSLLIALIWFMGFYHSNKFLPNGMSLEGEIYHVDEDSVEFLYDLTSLDESGDFVVEHEIFDRIFELVDGAEEFILIDMFLWSKREGAYRDLGQEMRNHLIDKKLENPNIKINVISDEYNTAYYSFRQEDLHALEQAGINVVYTDMTKMRDSNVLYSPLWRAFGQVWGDADYECEDGFIKYSGYTVCFRSALKLLNSKANHRKVFVADSGEKVVSLVTSANPSATGSKYSNVAMLIEEEIWKDIVESEKNIAKFSGGEFLEPEFENVYSSGSEEVEVQFLTEGKIRKNLVKEINSAESGEGIDVAMFLLTEEKVLKALSKASKRGVNVRIILDPSKNLFGRNSLGVPNLPANYMLEKFSGESLQTKWYSSEDQQYHSKMIVIRKSDGRVIVFLGSANLTRRNIGDLNLEADVKVVASENAEFVREILDYYEMIWSNEGRIYTTDESPFGKPSLWQIVKYKFQEETGFGAF